ncbi:MAG: CRTAC1 family protein [Paracoccaceae bacterium]
MTHPIRLSLPALLLASAATAQSFAPVDVPEHRYDGPWEHFVGGGVAALDCDGDALPDLVAAGGATPVTLLRNGGAWSFVAGDMPEVTGATGVYPVDLDADGILDLMILRAGPDMALKGDGACGFDARIDLPSGGERWTTAFTAWWDGGARPTLALGAYVDRADPDGPFGACGVHAILGPDGDGWAEEVLAPGYCTLSMLAARDARGRPTLRISNDRHYHQDEGVEQMWDIAEQRFLGAEDGWRELRIFGMGIASRDVTGDGVADVMLTSMGDNVLQMAEAGGYAAAPFEMGLTAQRPHVGDATAMSTAWHAQWGDVDNDGRADLFIAKGNVDEMEMGAMEDPNNLLMQRPDGTFREASVEAGVADTARGRGAALVDLDLDGRLDLVVVNRRAPLMVWRNETPEAGAWLNVSLSQPGGNAFGVGALVTVETDGGAQVQELTVGGGHAGGQMTGLHFGLGDAEAATVRVEWPDGQVTQVETGVDRRVEVAR